MIVSGLFEFHSFEAMIFQHFGKWELLDDKKCDHKNIIRMLNCCSSLLLHPLSSSETAAISQPRWLRTSVQPSAFDKTANGKKLLPFSMSAFLCFLHFTHA